MTVVMTVVMAGVVAVKSGQWLLNRVSGSPQRANRVAEAGWVPVLHP